MVRTRQKIRPKLRIKNYSFFIITCVKNYKKYIYFDACETLNNIMITSVCLH